MATTLIPPGAPCSVMRWLLALLFVVAFSGCTDDAEPTTDPTETTTPTSSPPSSNVTGSAAQSIVVDVQLTGAYPVNIAYDPARIEVPAGSLVTLRFTNNDLNPVANHDWVLEGVDEAATEVIANGETTEITFAAPDVGEYAFYCSVGNHRSVGMEGVFVVSA